MRSILRKAAAAICVGLVSVGAATADNYTAASTARVSQGTFGGAVQSNAGSVNVRMSKNGRFLVFESTASNLISGGTTPGRRHIYLYDRQADSLELIDRNLSGNESLTDSTKPAVSGDGRYVAFVSSAPVASMVSVCDAPGCHVNIAYEGQHIYVRDRLANKTFLVDQAEIPVRRQAVNQSTLQWAVADADPPIPSATPQPGKVPVLETVSRRITAGILNGTDVDPASSDNPRITSDGQYVVYDTDADNLIVYDPIYRNLIPGVDFNPSTGVTIPPGQVFLPTGYYKDVNGSIRDIYARDGQSFANSLVSLSCKFHAPEGCAIQGTDDSVNPSISDDGVEVVFSSTTPFLDLDFNGVSDVYLIKRTKFFDEVASLIRVSNNATKILAANGASTNPAISADGRYVAFQSAATNIVNGDTNGRTDIFVYDVAFNKTILCSSGSNGNSTVPDLNGDGQYVSFQSDATNLGGSNGFTNIYVGKISKLGGGSIGSCDLTLASAGGGTGGNAGATLASVARVPKTQTVLGAQVRVLQSAVAYQSTATDLAAGITDTNGVSDIFQSPLCSSTDLTTDTDFDGTSDCFDQCWKDALKVEDDDGDGDGVANCEDICPSDPQKVVAGICGCGVADIDSDGDGTLDCGDTCPLDPAKTSPGSCGCGVADVDLNGNGTADCLESNIPPATPVPTGTPLPVDISGYTPVTASLRAGNRGQIAITIPVPPIAAPVKHYLVRFTKTTGNRTQTFTRRTIGGVLTGFRSGNYRATYRIVTEDGQNSLWSGTSNRVRVR